VTHDPELAPTCTRVVRIEDGRVSEEPVGAVWPGGRDAADLAVWTAAATVGVAD
jgi:hypothetical protein